MLSDSEQKLISVIYWYEGEISHKQVKKLYKETFFLQNEDWRKHPSGLPLWEYSLRKSYHSLKDMNFIEGHEFQKWKLTKEGMEVAQWLNLPLEYAANITRTVESTARQIVRDTPLVRGLKEKYKFQCQVCGRVTKIGKIQFYAEAHHMKPLGAPHHGPDVSDNLIILCAQHHVEFDYQIMALNPTTMLIEHHDLHHPLLGKRLVHSLHKIDNCFLNYHYQLFLEKRKGFGV